MGTASHAGGSGREGRPPRAQVVVRISHLRQRRVVVFSCNHDPHALQPAALSCQVDEKNTTSLPAISRSFQNAVPTPVEEFPLHHCVHWPVNRCPKSCRRRRADAGRPYLYGNFPVVTPLSVPTRQLAKQGWGARSSRRNKAVARDRHQRQKT
jgi:hypothetical protein